MPGPLWWALDWASAEKHSRDLKQKIPDAPRCSLHATEPARHEECPDCWQPAKGTVVLIDEIDKADSDVPNGLLDVLGSGTFRPRGYDHDLCVQAECPPLVIITTNEERALPDAFVRRCLVLSLALPEDKSKLVELLVSRGRAHFKGRVSDAVLHHAASQLMDDRKAAKERRVSPPGQAEYLDLVRAVIELEEEDEARLALLDRIAEYALKKHPEQAPP